MANKRFPTDMPQKVTPSATDLVLIADSASGNSAAYATVQSIQAAGAGNVSQASNSGSSGRLKVSAGANKNIQDYAIAGIVKSDVNGVASAAVAGTDYLAPNGNGSALTGITASQVSAVPSSYLDTDGTLAANSDSKVATQKATKTYADTKAPIASPTFTGTVTVPSPSNATDAATKAYVDSVAQGLSAKPSAVCGTTSALPSYVYNNGTSGVGATITAVATGALTIDGHTVALNEYVLVKDETAGNAPYNGLYKCTVAGAVGVLFVLTRSVEMDASTEFSGGFVFVESGTVNAGAGFVCTNTGSVTVGTTAITFTQFSGAGEITAGTGLSKSGNTLSIDTNVTVDKTTSQALTNKTYNGVSVTNGGSGALTVTGTTSVSGTNTGDETATSVGAIINGATAKTTPVDADMFGLMDSAASNVLKKFSWANIKTALNSLYAAIGGSVSQTFGASTVELGHATDTTISRVSAGVIAVEGDTVPTLSKANTWTGVQTIPQVIASSNAITASGNAATVPITSKVNTVTNNSAATITITMATANAVDGQISQVRVLDFSAVAQTITWVNTENGEATAPTTSNGSTTLPRAALFQYNSNTGKWRCIAS